MLKSWQAGAQQAAPLPWLCVDAGTACRAPTETAAMLKSWQAGAQQAVPLPWLRVEAGVACRAPTETSAMLKSWQAGAQQAAPLPWLRVEAGTACRAPAGAAAMLRSWRAGARPACGRRALRSRTAGSQDESRCGAIHKQRPYLAVRADRDLLGFILLGGTWGGAGRGRRLRIWRSGGRG